MLNQITCCDGTTTLFLGATVAQKNLDISGAPRAMIESCDASIETRDRV